MSIKDFCYFVLLRIVKHEILFLKSFTLYANWKKRKPEKKKNQTGSPFKHQITILGRQVWKDQYILFEAKHINKIKITK